MQCMLLKIPELKLFAHSPPIQLFPYLSDHRSTVRHINWNDTWQRYQRVYYL